ncbi:amino acid ABC transporter substrate-binding protein [Salinivibrio kushneri]|nr:transporter substrate-binding domain-containing protein [Salinivibrio kushneri]QCP03576.1 amino acid ABC transporter substrate-binding protein [Salinivibrio kushneri]
MTRWWILMVCWLPLSGLANTLTVAYRDHTGAMSSATKAIVERVFDSVDPQIELAWIEMPLARAENALAKGIIDIDFGRTRLVYQDTPQALYPSESLFSVGYHLFGHTYVGNPQDYQRVVGVIGDQVAQMIADKYQWEMVGARSERAALNMVNSNRVQAMVAYVGVASIIEKEQLTNVRMGDNPIESIPIYFAIHQRHQALLERLDASIGKMKKSGEMAALLEKHGATY